MKLLIVEDELDLLKAIAKGLEKEGYIVDKACDGEEARDFIYSNIYDCIVLDLNLPFVDGLELIKDIQKNSETTKIIIVSARGTIEDRVIGLNEGACDYLVKPFSFQELVARIGALVRRDFKQHKAIIECKEFNIDTIHHALYDKNGTQIKLTSKEYCILEYLALNQNRPVTSGMILEAVWGSDADDFSDTVKVHISTLRKKLNNCFHQDFIEYVSKVGYRLRDHHEK